MAFQHGKSTNIQVDDTGGTLRDLTAYVMTTNWEAMERDLHDVTTHGNSGHREFPGLAAGSVTLEGNFDPTATTGPDAVLGALLLGQTATATIQFGPYGTTAGFVKYTGEFWIKSYKVNSQSTDMVKFTAEFTLDGIVTRTTF